MITTTPVAQWSWGRDLETTDGVSECVKAALGSFAALSQAGLTSREAVLRLKVREFGNRDSLLYQADIAVSDQLSEADVNQIAAEVKRALAPGRTGTIDADVLCSGQWRGEDGQHREGQIFTLATSVTAGYLVVRLQTFSDAWMRYDLKGHEQAAAYRRNQPALASALSAIAAEIGEETDPDDPTWFGVPTETGVDNYFDEDGSARDVWNSFEIPYRKRVFHYEAGFTQAGYKKSTTAEITYVPVVDATGVLGYVWAADSDQAASYEPRDVAGERAFEVGLLWLEQLRKAKELGLSPSGALTALRNVPAEACQSQILPGSQRIAPDLATLREIAASE